MQRGQDSFVYDSHHRLIKATVDDTTATYAYNVHHQRTRKTVNGTTTQFFYGPDGDLLAEIDAVSGATQAEYVWLDGTPLAYLADGDIYHVHVDHLGTPQVLTDATGAIAWEAHYRPFGDAITTGTRPSATTPPIGSPRPPAATAPWASITENHLPALKGHYQTVAPPADPLP